MKPIKNTIYPDMLGKYYTVGGDCEPSGSVASTGIPSSEVEVEGYLLEDKWKNNFDSHANADRPIDRRQTTQTNM